MLGGTSLRRSVTAVNSTSQKLTFVLQSNRTLSSFVTKPQFKRDLSKNKLLFISRTTIPSISGLRFNSSSSLPTPSAQTTAAPENGLNVEIPGEARDITELSPLDIEKIPEEIGYLKELGLDYGWGPSAVMEWLIEHIHIWTGLPWWASIVGAGLALRVLLLKPVITASDVGAKMRQLKPQIDPIRQRMLQSARSGNPIDAQKARAELKDLNQAHGLVAWKSFVPLLQIPFGYGCFRVVRGMSALPVPGLSQEQIWWIADLTAVDPYFVLPAVTSGVLYLSLKKGGETGMTILQDSSMGKAIMIGLPAMSFVFMSFWPSSLQLYFAFTGLFGLAQTYFINSPAIRQWLKLTPLPGSSSSSSSSSSGSGGQRLRLIEVEKEAEPPMSVTRELPADVSRLDRWKTQLMKPFTDMSQEVKTSVNKWAKEKTGSENTLPPRLSKADLQRAEEYERSRREEEIVKRHERNAERKRNSQRRKRSRHKQ